MIPPKEGVISDIYYSPATSTSSSYHGFTVHAIVQAGYSSWQQAVLGAIMDSQCKPPCSCMEDSTSGIQLPFTLFTFEPRVVFKKCPADRASLDIAQ